MKKKTKGVKTEKARSEKIQISAMLDAVEEERKHIARELHDGFAQVMASIMRQAEFCEKYLDQPEAEFEREELKAELRQLADVARQCLSDLRKFMVKLRPSSLDDLGLLPAIRRYVSNFDENTGPWICLNVKNEIGRFQKESETHIFRIVQEAINNAVKHSGAKNVSVDIRVEKKVLKIRVTDDGKGFEFRKNFGELMQSKKFGLAGMFERVELINGRIDVKSRPGSGTTIELRVSCKE